MDIEKVKAVSIKAGDVVVVQYDKFLPVESVEAISAFLRDRFPDNKCMVLDGGAELSVVSKQNEEPVGELTALLDKARSTLELARNGLVWYIENTNQASGCDDEALLEIKKVLLELEKVGR